MGNLQSCLGIEAFHIGNPGKAPLGHLNIDSSRQRIDDHNITHRQATDS